MASHHEISIMQLRSGRGLTYINVDENINGGISVWGGIWQPNTYLIKERTRWVIIVFDSNDIAQEWLRDHQTVDITWELISENVA